MSHRASHWLADIPADHMTHGAFRVLFHLCDAHNSQRPPETACFPSQAFLMDATGLSNSGLNKILNDLERDGLLVRRRTRNADGTRGPTYYILGCDLEEAQPTPLSGDGSKGEQTDADSGNGVVEKPVHKPVDKSPSNSTRAHKPTPLKRTNQLHRSGDKPVKEPLKEPQPDSGVPVSVKSAASCIRSGIPSMCSSIKKSTALACIEAGLVSHEDCRRVNITL